MQPSSIKRPGGICDRSSGDRSDVLGIRERPASRVKINTATVKECPVPVPFRHPASSLHPRTVMTHEFHLIFYPPFSPFFLNLRDSFPILFTASSFFSQLAPMQLFLEEYPGWSSFRNGRVGMWNPPFRKEDAPAVWAICVGNGGYLRDKIIRQTDYVRRDKRGTLQN